MSTMFFLGKSPLITFLALLVVLLPSHARLFGFGTDEVPSDSNIDLHGSNAVTVMTGTYPVDTAGIAECVRLKEIAGKRYRRKNEHDTFHLDYGDAAIEVFHSLSLHQLKSIDRLAECTRELDPRLYIDRSQVGPPLNTSFGGSNVTYLTGLFQAVLPDIHASIKETVSEAMREAHETNTRSLELEASEAVGTGLEMHAHNWEVDMVTLGLRAARYTSYFNKVKRKSSFDRKKERFELRQQAAAKRERVRALERKKFGKEMKAPNRVIGGDVLGKAVMEQEKKEIDKLEKIQKEIDAGTFEGEVPDVLQVTSPSIEEERLELASWNAVHDPLADENLGPYLRADGLTIYTVIIPLNEREEHVGGEVFIRKERRGHHAGMRPGQKDHSATKNDSNHNDDSNSTGEEEDEYDDEDEIDVGYLETKPNKIGVHDYVDGDTSSPYAIGSRTSQSHKNLVQTSLDRLWNPHFIDGQYGRKRSNDEATKQMMDNIKDYPVYSAFHTRISRYTPDRGNLLILRSDYEHGLEPLTHGRRISLELEYWAYDDATPEERRPGAEHARQQPGRWRDL